MSRSYHQSHPISRSKNKRNPKSNRKRKHKPYGLHFQYSKKYLKYLEKQGYSLDVRERYDCTDVSNKNKARREGKKEIRTQIDEIL